MFKSDKRQRREEGADEKLAGRGPSKPRFGEQRADRRPAKGTGRFDADADVVDQIRWVPWTLAILVIVCLVLAAWVWFEILHV